MMPSMPWIRALRTRCSVVHAGALLLLFAVGCGGSSGSTASPSTATIELVRDRWGVPHVFAQTDTGAYYGLGWAAAEDRFLQMTWARLELEGRLAEVLGRDPGDGSDRYLEHDLEMRLKGFARTAERIVAELDPQTRSWLEAYAKGVNDYLASPVAQLAPDFQSLGVPVEPWTPAASVLSWLRLGVILLGELPSEVATAHAVEDLASQGKTPEEIVEALLGVGVFDEAAAVVQQSDVPLATQVAMADYAAGLGLSSQAPAPPGAWELREPTFSQSWVVSGAATQSNQTVVVSDPRLPLGVPSFLWEAHFVGASFEARGAAPPGSPNFLVGATRRVAWGGSALGMDQADLYRIETDPAGHPGEYYVDGAWKPFLLEENESVLIAGESPVTLRYRETEWGPVVTRFAGDDLWLPDTAADEEYALRWAPATTPEVSCARAFGALYRAPDAAGFAAALEEWNTPPLHVVFGDRDGGIGFWAAGALPVRSQANLLAGLAAQDGSDSASAWLDIVPHALKPGVLDPERRFIHVANHLPVGSWYPIPFVRGGGHSARSARLLELLESLLPTPGASVDPGAVIALRSDPVWTFGRDLALVGLALRDGFVGVDGAPAALGPQAEAVLGWLEPWVDADQDGPVQVDLAADGALQGSQAAHALAFQLGRLPFRSTQFGGNVPPELIAVYGSGEGGFAYFLRTLRAQVSAGTDLDSSAAAFVEFALAKALEATVQATGAAGLSPSWSAWFDANVQSAALPHYASLLGLPAFGNGSVPVGPVEAGAPTTLAGQLEAAHTQTATLLPGGSAALRTLNPLGQSEHPASAHHADQRALWEGSPQAMKDQPFDRAELAAVAGPLQVTLLEEGSGLAQR